MITEDIDLTLDSMFSELYVPEIERKHNTTIQSNKSIVDSDNLFYKTIWSDYALNSVYVHAILYGTQYDDILMEDTIETYHSVFGEYPIYTNYLDPYFYYFQGAGVSCDCCGKKLQILNKKLSNTLCEDCDEIGLDSKPIDL